MQRGRRFRPDAYDRTAFDSIDFGPPEELRLCLLADQGITEEHARQLVARVADEFTRYRIDVTVPWVRAWQRPAFSAQGIIEHVLLHPLEAPCDRLLALVGRNFADFVAGLAGMEVLGAVDTATHTRGFVVARMASFNQVLNSPARVIVHESYHLLGCDHDITLARCYARIRQLKKASAASRGKGSDFFPGLGLDGALIESRSGADFLVHDAVMKVRLARLDALHSN